MVSFDVVAGLCTSFRYSQYTSLLHRRRSLEIGYMKLLLKFLVALKSEKRILESGSSTKTKYLI